MMTKFKNMAYGKDESIVAIWMMEDIIQLMSKKLIGRKLTSRELSVLRKKLITELTNLIIKIGSSGIGNEKES